MPSQPAPEHEGALHALQPSELPAHIHTVYCISGSKANQRDSPEKVEAMLRVLYSAGGTKFVDPQLVASATAASFRRLKKDRKGRSSNESDEGSTTSNGISVTPGSSAHNGEYGLSVLGRAGPENGHGDKRDGLSA